MLRKGVIQQMRFAARLFLALFGLFLVLVGMFLVALSFNLVGDVGTSLQPVVGDLRYSLVALIIIILGAALLTAGLRKKAEDATGTINQFTNLGELRISFKAIESMILRSSRKVKGVRDTKTKITSTEQGLVIYLKVKVLPDLKIPPLVEELQHVVQQHIEEICGAAVSEVKVFVENTAADGMISHK